MSKFLKRSDHQPITKDWLLGRIGIDANGCWIWNASIMSNGYGALWDGKSVRNAASVAYEVFVGPIPDGHLVRHSCDVRACINPRHLLTGTDADNQRDSVDRGRHKHCVFHGENHPNAKFTNVQVLEIRAAKGTHAELAKQYAVHRRTIGLIKRRQSYGSV